MSKIEKAIIKGLGHISLELKLSKGAIKTLLYLMAETKITNEIKLPVQTITDTLKFSTGNTYSFLNELKKHNILIWDQKLKTMRLNYDF